MARRTWSGEPEDAVAPRLDGKVVDVAKQSTEDARIICGRTAGRATTQTEFTITAAQK